MHNLKLKTDTDKKRTPLVAILTRFFYSILPNVNAVSIIVRVIHYTRT